MVQFLSIIFFPWISSIFVGFFQSSRFFGSPCTYCYPTAQNMPQLKYLPQVGKSFCISCWHQSVSCVINHRVKYSSTKQTSLNLWQLRLDFDAGHRWLSLGYEFPWCNGNEDTFLTCQVRLCVTHSRLRCVYLSDWNFTHCLYKVCNIKTLFGYSIFPSAYSLECTRKRRPVSVKSLNCSKMVTNIHGTHSSRLRKGYGNVVWAVLVQ